MIKITDSLRARVQDHEGLRTSMYLDSLGKATVGIGHLVQPHERKRFQEGVQITQEEADELFDIDLNRAAAGADDLILKKIGSHDDLPQSVQEVLVEMVFQLGATGVKQFRNMWASLKEKDGEMAAMHMKDSRWHKQTKKRCESLAKIVATAQWT